MTQFRRSGHWRRNRNGSLYWVTSHSVDRDSGNLSLPFDGSGCPPADDGLPAVRTIPSAHCPVCGASVFFYQNEAGSRVFFDHLGPPWPKHPCTDNGVIASSTRATVSKSAGLASSNPPDLLTLMDMPAPSAGSDGTSSSNSVLSGWMQYSVIRLNRHDSRVHVVAFDLGNEHAKRIRFSTDDRPDLPVSGEPIYLLNNRMSFFSMRDFSPKEVDIARKLHKSRAVRHKRGKKSKKKK